MQQWVNIISKSRVLKNLVQNVKLVHARKEYRFAQQLIYYNIAARIRARFKNIHVDIVVRQELKLKQFFNFVAQCQNEIHVEDAKDTMFWFLGFRILLELKMKQVYIRVNWANERFKFQQEIRNDKIKAIEWKWMKLATTIQSKATEFNDK